MTNIALDGQSLREAKRMIERAIDALPYLESEEHKAKGRIERESEVRAMCSIVQLAGRHGEEVLERHHYEQDLARAAPRPKE